MEEKGCPILTILWTQVSGIWGPIRLPRNTKSGLWCVVQILVGRYLDVVHGVELHALGNSPFLGPWQGRTERVVIPEQSLACGRCGGLKTGGMWDILYVAPAN